MPLAHRAAPRSTLLGVRGRSTEEGVARWFRRFEGLTFDQQDIRDEAEAFAAFVEGAISAYRLDPARLTFIGHSNGANFLAAVMLLQPHIVSRAALLRPMPILTDLPQVDLGEGHVLVVAGRDDPFAPHAPELATLLQARGAQVTMLDVGAGHDASLDDVRLIRTWLAAIIE